MLFSSLHLKNVMFIRVMVQVSCSIQVPKSSRANEGMLFINVEMSTMAAEHFEAGRLGQQGIEVNRLVERCIKGKRFFIYKLSSYITLKISRFTLC